MQMVPHLNRINNLIHLLHIKIIATDSIIQLQMEIVQASTLVEIVRIPVILILLTTTDLVIIMVFPMKLALKIKFSPHLESPRTIIARGTFIS